MSKDTPQSISLQIDGKQLESLRNSIASEVLEMIQKDPQAYLPKQEEPLKLYSVEEVAKILDLSENTTRTYINNGDLGCYRPGRNIKVSQEQLNDYLKSIKSN